MQHKIGILVLAKKKIGILDNLLTGTDEDLHSQQHDQPATRTETKKREHVSRFIIVASSVTAESICMMSHGLNSLE
jgi:hypothetical protein